MTGSIARKLYQQCLLLYPEPFRCEFKAEMLGIFEECRGIQGSFSLLVDLVLSAAKQQVHYRSTPAPKSTPLYSEIQSAAPNLARMLGVAALGTALLTGVLVGGMATMPESKTVVLPEVIFWFPIIPQGRFCSGAPKRAGKPENILTTGVLMRGNVEAPDHWTVVRSRTGFWISTTPWGQYCLDAPAPAETREKIL